MYRGPTADHRYSVKLTNTTVPLLENRKTANTIWHFNKFTKSTLGALYLTKRPGRHMTELFFLAKPRNWYTVQANLHRHVGFEYLPNNILHYKFVYSPPPCPIQHNESISNNPALAQVYMKNSLVNVNSIQRSWIKIMKNLHNNYCKQGNWIQCKQSNQLFKHAYCNLTGYKK